MHLKYVINSPLMDFLREFKVFVSSRGLFRNWFSAGIRYYLIKRGLVDGSITARFRCGDGWVHVLSPWVYSLIVNAYYDGLFRLVCDDKLIGRFFGFIDLIHRDGELLLRMPDGILLTIESFDPTIIAETWLYDIHFLGFDLNDWFVLDIGAFVGDTALYYARRGAFVVAVEPLPSNYETMIRNLELNPELKPRIIPINAAISGVDGFVEFRYNATIDGGASIHGMGRFVTKVRSVRLSTLIRELESRGIGMSKFRVRVLKVDCKGCEYELVNDDSLRLFDIVKIEYNGHLINKTYHELMGRLGELGFRCRVWAHNELAIEIGLDRHGTMTCIKEGWGGY
jgi:FkbM family methyltransferase